MQKTEILTNTKSSDENKDVGFQVTTNAETAMSQQILVMETDPKKLDDSESSKESIVKISDDHSDKLEAESCKDSVNEESEPKELNNIIDGRFGYSVLKSCESQDQSRESKYEVDNFEVNTQQLRNWLSNQIESADDIRFFESKYIRKIVTDLGGDVLKEFVDKLRQLKMQEKENEARIR